MKMIKRFALAATLAFTAVPIALAHHSFGLFDTSQTTQIAGTVYRFEWSNPHSWLWISVAQKSGARVIWGIETGSPTMLLRRGIARLSFKPGDRVTVDLHPMRDGRPGGNFVRATFADGHSLAVVIPKG